MIKLFFVFTTIMRDVAGADAKSDSCNETAAECDSNIEDKDSFQAAELKTSLLQRHHDASVRHMQTGADLDDRRAKLLLELEKINETLKGCKRGYCTDGFVSQSWQASKSACASFCSNAVWAAFRSDTNWCMCYNGNCNSVIKKDLFETCQLHGGGGGNDASCKNYGCWEYVASRPCQCNDKCRKYKSCCSDFHTVCEAPPDVPSNAPVLNFYMYRSVSDEVYPPLNTNLASLGGALWYLQNEVVNRCDDGRGGGAFGYRRFRITRMLRYNVTLKTSQPLYNLGMNFGTRVAFDKGKCTGSWNPKVDCGPVWEKFGYIVGCNELGHGPYPTCAPYGANSGEGFCPITYPKGYWYSFPGACPDTTYDKPCNEQGQGGYDPVSPKGTKHSTFTFKEAGEINLDELSGVTPKYRDHKDFCNHGCLEYVKYGGGSDKGKCGISFYNDRHSANANKERVRKADALFKKNYPNMPSDEDMPPPPCDFDKDKFYAALGNR